ncbi:MAG: DUF2339 domain-containing protein [Fusobacteriaceae bacterium]
MKEKKVKLELLEKNYQEIKKLNLEAESIILEIKNDVDINREIQILEEKEVLDKTLKKIKIEFQTMSEEFDNLKTSNMILLDELKENKRLKRENEIDKFYVEVAKKIKIDLEDGIINKLSTLKKEFYKKINIEDKELMKEIFKESHELKEEVDNVANKINIFLANSQKKALASSIKLNDENFTFHSEIKNEYDLKEEEYLFEKEKKNFVLEKLIGLKGFNFLGIISIFLGIFLAFKTEFKNFFYNDYIKSSGSYLLGIIFLFVGEKLYKNNKKHFAVGIIGGGVGILYLSTFLSTMYLGLFPQILGLFISIILTGIVTILALRYNSQIIGILALIGGFLPYGVSIYHGAINTKIYYLIIYSLILQGIILGISWNKDWLYSKIIGFIIGVINLTGIVFYLSKQDHKLSAFFYIIIFTTAYSFIFLNSHKKENRNSSIIDYILLSINLILKFSLISSLSDPATPNWIKAGLVIVVGILYGFLGDKLKENRVSKIFYVIALGCFIVIIPLILSKEFAVLAWGGEAIFLYFMSLKYKNTEIKYGVIFIYLITLFANFLMREANYYLLHIQDILTISLSFVVYLTVKEKSYNKTIQNFLIPFKYFIFLYSIYFITNIVYINVYKIEKITSPSYISTFLAILVVNILLRRLTYKVKELQDKFSLIFLTLIQIFSILINIITLFSGRRYYVHWVESVVGIVLILAVNIYLFIFGKNDIYITIFKTSKKKISWLIGEAVYIILVSYLIMKRAFLLEGVNLIITIVGLLTCGYLVWRGFRTYDKNLRRTGLGIGIFFILKSFFFDFTSFSTTYKLLAYFGMGIILIGTSYIYQTAIKKLEKGEKNE